MINPLEVIIKAVLEASPTLAGGRVASRHHYIGENTNGLWNIADDGIAIGLDGGNAELDLPVHDIRLEVRCFSSSQSDALNLLLLFRAALPVLQRFQVTASGGEALLYYVIQESGPSLLYDPELAKEFALQFFRARIHEQGVT